MVRRKDIGHAVLDLIDYELIDEAFELFARECDPSKICTRSQEERADMKRCAAMCLLPKLSYHNLGRHDADLEQRIEDVKNKLAQSL